MSRLAQEWIERNLSIPRKIKSLEYEFSNGYYFLLLLEQKGLLEDYEMGRAGNATTPEMIKNNFDVLTPALHRLGVAFSKKDAAKIISEEAGSAAQLIMKLKSAIEERGKSHSSVAPDYVSATRSIRFKEYYNEEEKFASLKPEERCIKDIFKQGLDGNFRDVDMAIHLRKFQGMKHKDDDTVSQSIMTASMEEESFKKERRATTLAKMDQTISTRISKAEKGSAEWKKNQTDKKKRQIRDLQFELAMGKKAELLDQRTRVRHSTDQARGIDEFEHNLRRQGLGGADSAPSELQPQQEDENSFLVRLEDRAQREWPSDAETRDFVLGLRMRTREVRMARLEKARRRRRMQVEQEAQLRGQTKETDDTDGDESDEGRSPGDEDSDSGEEDLTDERQLEILDAHRKFKEDSEDSVRIFAESFRLASTETEDERKATLAAVLKTRQNKELVKHMKVEEMCYSLVFEILEEVFDNFGDGRGGTKNSVSRGIKSNPMTVNDSVSIQSSESYNLYLSLARMSLRMNNVQGGSNAELLSDSAILNVTKLDVWPAVVALVRNIGRWSLKSAASSSRAEGDSLQSAEELEESKEVDSSVAPKVFTKEADSDSLSPRTSSIIQVASGLTLQRRLAIADVMRSSLEAVVAEEAVGAALAAGRSGTQCRELSLNTQEFGLLQRSICEKGKVILVLGDDGGGCSCGMELPPAVWKILSGLIGSQSSAAASRPSGVIGFFDYRNALSVVSKLKSGVANSKKGLDVSILVDSFGFNAKEAGSVTGHEVSPLAGKIVSELLEYYGKFRSLEAAFDLDPAMDLSDVPFTDFTLYSIFGSVLWLRCYLRQLWLSSHSKESCPLPPVVIAGRMWSQNRLGKSALPATPQLARVFDWFLRGGTRDNIPDSDAELSTLAQQEWDQEQNIAAKLAAAQQSLKKGKSGVAGAGAASKAKKSKGKEKGDALASSRSLLSAVLWVNGAGNTANGEEENRVLQTVPAKDKDKDTDTSTDEHILIAYGEIKSKSQAASDTEVTGDVPLISFAEYLANVPVYKIHLKPDQNLREAVTEIGAGEGEVPDGKPCYLQNFPIAVTACTSFGIAEALQAIILDISQAFRYLCCIDDLSPVLPETALVEASEDGSKKTKDRKLSSVAAQESFVPTEPVDKALAKAVRRLRSILDSRRARLSFGDSLKALHCCGEKRLERSYLVKVLSSLAALRSKETEQLGLLVLTLFYRLQIFQKTVQEYQASLISSLKSTDPRMRAACTKFHDKLVAYQSKSVVVTEDDLSHESDNLICAIGDCIDERHLGWLKFISAHVDDITTEQNEIVEVIMELSKLFGEALLQYLERCKTLATDVVKLLSLAGYSSFPFPLPLSSARGARLAMERRKDELRTMATKLRDIGASYASPELSSRSSTNMVNQSHKSYFGLQEESWRRIASMETGVMVSTIGNEMVNDIMLELTMETLEMALGITTTLLASVSHVVDLGSGCIRDMKVISKKRFNYEHSLLNSWSVELREASTQKQSADRKTTLIDRKNSFHSNHSLHSLHSLHSANSGSKTSVVNVELRNLQNFLTVSYFGLSSDQQSDGVEWITYGHVVDMRDMTLPIAITVELSKELHKRCNSTKGGIPSNAMFLDVLRTSVQELVDRGVGLPTSWRTPARLSELVTSIVTDTKITCDDFCRRLIMSLVLGTLPSAPSADYLTRIGHIFSTLSDSLTDRNFHFTEQMRPKLDRFVQKSLQDPVLSMGWWLHQAEYQVSAADREKVRLVLTALAAVCLDAKGAVIVDELLMMMCKGPNFLDNTTLEKLLTVAPYSIDVDSTELSKTLTPFPGYLNDGLCKAAAIAARVPSDAEAVKGVPETEAVNKGTLNKPIYVPMADGPILTHAQTKWYLKSSEFSLLESKAWMDVADFWLPLNLTYDFIPVELSSSDQAYGMLPDAYMKVSGGLHTPDVIGSISGLNLLLKSKFCLSRKV